MPNRTPQEILTDLEATKAVADRPLELYNQAVRSGHEMAIRNANNKLVTLKTEYTNSLFTNAVAFNVTGAQAAEFARFAEGLGAVTFDFMDLPRKLATSIGETMGKSRQFGVTQIDRLHKELDVLATGLGIRTNMPNIPGQHTPFYSHDELAGFVRQVIEGIGHGFRGAYLRHAASVKAFDKKRSHLAISFLNANAADMGAFASMFKTVTPVEVPADVMVDEAYVVSVFESGPKAAKTTEKQKPNKKNKENEGNSNV